MARVRPFAGFRYATTSRDITSLTAPPYDVISPAQRDEFLAADEHNVVALELPTGPLDASVPGNRYETGAATWNAWREEGVLAADESPAIYVLEQRFTHDGQPVRRRALIAEVGLEPFSAGVVLPHERTLPKALGDRFELTKATGANLSQVLGLYEDAQQATDAAFDAVMATEPVASATDADGVSSVLWATTDPQVIASIGEILADSRIFIADGHHRYTTALAYRDLRREQATETGETPVDPAYDFVMMALVNLDDPELLVMPTHRVADATGDFEPAAFWSALESTFVVEEVQPDDIASALEGFSEPAFLIKTRDGVLKRVRVRDDVDLEEVIALDRSKPWKHLDVAVLQELVLDPLLGIHPDRPETLERLGFVKDAGQALAMAGERDAVAVLRPTRMDQLRAVALAGETMPQKSTYFYPKLLSGLVFRSAE